MIALRDNKQCRIRTVEKKPTVRDNQHLKLLCLFVFVDSHDPVSKKYHGRSIDKKDDWQND